LSKLALLGGRPVLERPLPPYRSIGAAERAAVARVLDSGRLSGFYGTWGDEFFGGPEVRALEAAWRHRFGTGHAVTVNSATSGLIAALGAVGVGPGDEVIVPPFTMSATAIAPLFYGAIPVFADVEPDTFCLDVACVSRCLTPRTRAIVAVDLFGHPARIGQLRRLADERGLMLIEDAAQSPLAAEGERLAGTVGHVGVFSLNVHKHVQSGEGGVCVTADESIARRLALIRNHGENAVESLGLREIDNLVGFNFRLTELSAAVARAQLAAIDEHVERRTTAAARLSEGIRGLPGLAAPVVREACRHVYYLWTVRCDAGRLGVTREAFSRALAAEGVPHFNGYVRPLYMLPVFQRRVAIGSGGFPFTLSTRQYPPGLCPVAETLYASELICLEVCAFDLDGDAIDRLAEAIRKVHALRHEIPPVPAPAPAGAPAPGEDDPAP
jgi:dTDP-4-amino-4,6-dideoxygalactose transaminase